MSVRTYNPSVRVGNWNEDIHLEEDTLKDFLDKKEKGQLLIQQSGNLAALALKKQTLSVTQDGYVHYGHIVQLTCKGAVDRTRYFAGVEPREDCTLALNINDPMDLTQGSFSKNCSVSGCRSMAPVLRNAFCIKSLNDGEDGDVLRYGQPFYITTPAEASSLYLHSDIKTFMKCAKKSRHQSVTLVSEPSFLTQWQVLHIDPRLRMEFEGAPVPGNVPVIIVHCKTNQNLAVEENFLVRTPMGREYEISAHTSLDSHKAEASFNVWHLTLTAPGESMISYCPDTNQTAPSSGTDSQPTADNTPS